MVLSHCTVTPNVAEERRCRLDDSLGSWLLVEKGGHNLVGGVSTLMGFEQLVENCASSAFRQRAGVQCDHN